MSKSTQTPPNSTEREYKYLWRGDIIKVAIELGCTYQKIKDFLRGRNNDPRIQATLHKLNEARKEQTERISNIATKNIITELK